MKNCQGMLDPFFSSAYYFVMLLCLVKDNLTCQQKVVGHQLLNYTCFYREVSKSSSTLKQLAGHIVGKRYYCLFDTLPKYLTAQFILIGHCSRVGIGCDSNCIKYPKKSDCT